jgi:tetratricopeptide (TPR) repeat protein
VEDRATSGVREIAPAIIAATRAQVEARQAAAAQARCARATPPSWKAVAPARAGQTVRPILAVYAKRIADKPQEGRKLLGAGDSSSRASMIARRRCADVDKVLALAPSDRILSVARAATRYAGRRREGAGGREEGARARARLGRRRLANMRRCVPSMAARDEALALVAERLKTRRARTRTTMSSSSRALLAEAGKADQAVAVLDTAIKATPGNPTLLNQRCWTKGTRGIGLDTALKDCTKAIELSDSSAHILDSRGVVYFRLGRMEDALADFDAALDQAPGMAASLFMRGVIRKQTGVPGGDEDLAGARLMAPRIDEDYAKYGIKP